MHNTGPELLPTKTLTKIEEVRHQQPTQKVLKTSAGWSGKRGAMTQTTVVVGDGLTSLHHGLRPHISCRVVRNRSESSTYRSGISPPGEPKNTDSDPNITLSHHLLRVKVWRKVTKSRPGIRNHSRHKLHAAPWSRSRLLGPSDVNFSLRKMNLIFFTRPERESEAAWGSQTVRVPRLGARDYML